MGAGTLLRKKTKQYGGYRTVVYRDAKGRTFLARVTSAGTGNTLNLLIKDRDRRTAGNTVLTNVAVGTTPKSTNAWYNVTA
jgi:hypothetical protein